VGEALIYPDRDDEFFWKGLQERQFLIQCCRGCTTLRYPPSPMCASCHSVDWFGLPATGAGRLYSWIVVETDTLSSTKLLAVLVDLIEGVRVVGNMRCEAGLEGLEAGMPVRLEFREGEALPLFEAAPSAHSG